MKTVVIGDIHGRREWKDIVAENGTDGVRYVFLGDYLDSHDDISIEQQCENFFEIAEFKRSNPDNVVLLIGNHDLHYYNAGWNCSQFSTLTYSKVHELMKEMVDGHEIELAVIDIEAKIIIIHAGLSRVWLKDHYGVETVDENTLQSFRIADFIFQAKSFFVDPYGYDDYQSPAWIRPQSLVSCAVDGFTQIVGHTGTNSGKITEYMDEASGNLFVFCDCMPNQYVEIGEDGVIRHKDVIVKK